MTWAAVTSLKPGQAWVPWMDRLGTEEGGEDMPVNEPFPMHLVCLFLSAPTHNLQIQAGPPAAEPAIVPPKDGGASGLEEFCKVPWALRLLVVGLGFPPPASFLRVTPPVDDTRFCRVVLQSGSVLGMEGKGEEVRRHKS